MTIVAAGKSFAMAGAWNRAPYDPALVPVTTTFRTVRFCLASQSSTALTFW